MTSRKIKRRFVTFFTLLGIVFFAAVFAADASPPSGAKYVEDQLLVRFKDNALAAKRASAHARVKSSHVKAFRHVPNLELIKLPPGLSVEQAIESYRAYPDVLYAEPNYYVTLLGVPNDPSFPSAWHLQNTGQTGGTPGADIKAVQAWDITTGSSDVVVAVIDTGVDYNHYDLAPNMWRNEPDCNHNGVDDDGNGYIDDCHGIDTSFSVFGVSDPMDVGDHGTAVAGLIGAVGNNALGVVGVNWNVKILPCKFYDGDLGTIADAIACLDYVKTMKERGVNIIATNNSWTFRYTFPQSLVDAIDAQRQAGILFVTSAASTGEDDDTTNLFPASLYLPNLIVVNASDDQDQLTLVTNVGPHTVHLSAPGINILSTSEGNGYANYIGTSFSAAQVTGVAALLKAQDLSRDWLAIKNLILAGADVLPELAGATITGGRLNAYNSLTCANRVVRARLRPMSDMFVTVGKPVNLAALHINCANANGAIQVTINPGNEIIMLQDDGVGYDRQAGDGIYSAVWTPQTTGVFTVTFPDGDVVTVLVLPDESLWCDEGIKGVSDTIVGDGTGGAIFATGKQDPILGNILFAHRLGADGRRVWDANGMTLAVLGRFGTESTNLINDGSGGAFITWKQLYPASTMRVLRIDSMGVIRWQAILSSKLAGTESGPQLAADGTGGVIATWWVAETSQVSLWGQRFSRDGQPLWGSDGKRIFAGPYNTFSNPQRISDGQGGVIVSWIVQTFNPPPTTSQVFLQRIAPDGVAMWQAGGVPVPGTTHATTQYALSSDGEGGAVFVWVDSHYPVDTFFSLKSQRVTGGGSVAWGSNAIEVTQAMGFSSIGIVNDAAGGAIVMWSNSHIGLQRIDNAGNAVWHYDALELAHVLYLTKMISDGAGGAILGYNDLGFDIDGRPGGVSSILELINVDGIGGWVTRVNQPITMPPGIVSDEQGGAIVTGIGLAQRFNANVEPYKICPGPPAMLTVAMSGTGSGSVKSDIGGIDCGGDCTASFDGGTPVVLSAAPTAGSVFEGWSGDADCSDGAVTMDANKNCVATFTAQSFSLTVTKTGAGAGSITSNAGGINCGAACSSGYSYNQNIVLTAVPEGNSIFSGWSGACTGTGPCNLQMSANRNVTASFTKRLTLTAPAAGAVWPVRSAQTIRWTTSETTPKVTIQISRDGGATWMTVTKTSNDGAQTWKVGKPATGQARIRVCILGSSPLVCDTSAPFTIQ
jgi:subtilisin family serine protease